MTGIGTRARRNAVCMGYRHVRYCDDLCQHVQEKTERSTGQSGRGNRRAMLKL